MIGTDIQIILPELLLAVFAMAALLFGVYTSQDKAARVITWATGIVFLVLAFWIGVNGAGERTAFGGMFIDDAFARFVKAGPFKFTPIIMLTTESQDTKKAEGKAAGVRAWITKPFQPSQLVDAVSRLCM